MFCTQCGQQLRPGDLFCSKCGASTTAAKPAAAETAHLPPVIPPAAPPRLPHHRRPVVAWVVGGLILLVFLYSCWPSPKPADAITQTRQALTQHDVESFHKYVNMDLVLDDGIDQLAVIIAKKTLSQTSPDATETEQALVTAGAHIAASLISQNVKPRIEQEVDKFVGMDNWKSADDANSEDDDNERMVIGFLNNVLKSQLTYQGSQIVSQSSDSAELDISMHTPLYSDPLIVRLKLQKTDAGHWQIVAVENLDKLVKW